MIRLEYTPNEGDVPLVRRDCNSRLEESAQTSAFGLASLEFEKAVEAEPGFRFWMWSNVEENESVIYLFIGRSLSVHSQ